MSETCGTIVGIKGSIIEVEWSERAPRISHILRGVDDPTLELTVLSSAGESSVYCSMLKPIDKLSRGMKVIDTQEPFSIPVGEAVLGRAFTLFGQPLDFADKPISRKETRPVISSTNFSINDIITTGEVIETGMKVVDFFTPVLKGGKTAIIGGAGLGKTVILTELINRLVIQKDQEKRNVAVFSAVGERSREALDIYQQLDEAKVLSRTSLIIGQMGENPAVRWHTAYASAAIAEHFRDGEKRDVFFFMDNIYRFAQAGNELSTLMKTIPSEDGYQPTLSSEMAALNQRLTSNHNGSITSFMALFVPSDEITNYGVRSILPYLDTIIVLSREIFQNGIFPAVDILASSSVALSEKTVGKDHYEAFIAAKKLLEKSTSLQRIVSLVGEQELSLENQVLYKRAEILRNFMTQDIFQSTATGDSKVTYVTREDTISGVRKILAGQCDGIPPEKFAFIGKIDERK